MNDLPESRKSAAKPEFHYDTTDTTDTVRGTVSLYWGHGPLPAGAVAEGLVTRDTGEKGALLRIGVRLLAEDLQGLPDTAFRPAPRAEILAAAQEAAELAATLCTLSENLVSHARAACAPGNKA